MSSVLDGKDFRNIMMINRCGSARKRIQSQLCIFAIVCSKQTNDILDQITPFCILYGFATLGNLVYCHCSRKLPELDYSYRGTPSSSSDNCGLLNF